MSRFLPKGGKKSKVNELHFESTYNFYLRFCEILILDFFPFINLNCIKFSLTGILFKLKGDRNNTLGHTIAPLMLCRK